MVNGKFLSLTARSAKVAADITKVTDKVSDIGKSANKISSATKGTSKSGAAFIEKSKEMFKKIKDNLDQHAWKSLENDMKNYEEQQKIAQDVQSSLGNHAHKIGKTENVIPKNYPWNNLWPGLGI